jgi:hypothetical protein
MHTRIILSRFICTVQQGRWLEIEGSLAACLMKHPAWQLPQLWQHGALEVPFALPAVDGAIHRAQRQ